jgi:AbrB family looped-hinge helix DNA binding protein
MSKVTSKLQVTIPKALAERYGIRPGDDVDWVPAGDAIRVVPGRAPGAGVDRSERLALFDAATERQVHRQAGKRGRRRPRAGRGWTREELYDRARAR